MTDPDPFLAGVIHLDARWRECFAPTEGYTAWPDDGFIGSLIDDPTLSLAATGVVVVIASYAAEGLVTIPVSRLAAQSADDQQQLAGSLRELAERGYITLTGGAQ